jgi:hypothetical protein
MPFLLPISRGVMHRAAKQYILETISVVIWGFVFPHLSLFHLMFSAYIAVSVL